MNTENDYIKFSDSVMPQNSIAVRIGLTILGIAIAVFVIGLVAYISIQEDHVKEEAVITAHYSLKETALNVEKYLVREQYNREGLPMNALLQDSMVIDSIRHIMDKMHPYHHSYNILLDNDGKYIICPDKSFEGKFTIFQRAETLNEPSLDSLGVRMTSGAEGMKEVSSGNHTSMAIYAPLGETGWSMAVVCPRLDVFASLADVFKYALLAFILGLIAMGISSFLAIRHFTSPLEQISSSATRIAQGDLNVTLPEIKVKDEMWHLRESFAYMQESLRKYIKELTETTANNERIKSELAIARKIQLDMIPKTFMHIPDYAGIEFYATLLPAKEVGGDLYDIFVYQDKMCFIVGDVSGKGVPAAMYMAMTMRVFRIACRHHINSAEEIAEALGRTMAENNVSDMFITAFIGVLDMKTHQLGYCNAGHNLPMLVSPSGKCSYLKSETNIPLGILERFDYEGYTMDFPEGSKLLVYTDGLTEAENEEKKLFGEDRLTSIMQKIGKSSPREIIESLDGYVKQFTDGTEQSDDLTILCISKVKNVNRIVLKNDMKEVARLKGFMRETSSMIGFSEDMLLSLNLAVEEAVVNVINYAYPEGVEGDIELCAYKTSDSVVFELKDQGIAFDPTKVGEADTTSDLDERQIGGLGIFLTKEMMDIVEYRRDGNTNVLTMKKTIMS